jgi:UDP-N-acetylbacillosamine transaminase
MEKAKFYATQAKENYLHYEHKEYGYNYRMSNVLAAIGVAQMEVLHERVTKKQQIFAWYKELLGDKVSFMPELKYAEGNRWLTTLLLKNESDVAKLIEYLQADHCESRPLWKPMHKQPLFKNAKVVSSGVSETLFARGICLPSGTQMEFNDVKRVCDIVVSI